MRRRVTPWCARRRASALECRAPCWIIGAGIAADWGRCSTTGVRAAGRPKGDAMTWWGWCIVGTLLLAAELFAVDAQFYLIFIGAAAVVVGFLGMIGVDLPGWAQWM